MRILVEMTHPAQAHFFRYAIGLWRRRGHGVLVASREKECLVPLLEQFRLDHVCLSRRGRGMAGLAAELARRHWRMLRLLGTFKPDVLVGRYCISAAPAGFLTRRPVVVFEDTEHATLQQRMTIPFATVICSTAAYQKDWGPRQVRYDGIDHLAYTHPSYFAPDPGARRRAGLGLEQPYALLRLVAWQAAHDVGQKGLSERDLEQLVATVQPHGRVLISSEAPLPAKWAGQRVRAPAGDMLSLLAFARIYVGEGASMASEAACLGVPAVYVNPLRVGYLKQLEQRYRLVRCVDTGPEAVAAAAEMLSTPVAEWRARRQRLLDEKQDVTAFVARIVERVGRGERPGDGPG